MVFNKESDFEETLIKILSEKGWEKEVLKNYSEEDLLRNWADILFENNRDIDRLNDYPLTDGEMQQTIDKNRAKEYFERIEGRKIIPPKVNIKVDKLLREFIIRGGFEIQMPEEYK